MPEEASKMEDKAKKPRRPRRSPEEMLQELERRKAKLEKRLIKKNQEAILSIGHAFIKVVGLDLSDLSPAESERIAKEPDYAMVFVRDRIKGDA
ncbi:hypothetical protein Taci_0739 [Thermanaerovibrio acidaminovorans DSM 6589]|uniref:Uncharacterized protein n=1 Tax=Thermanaerovibrio acidaminovorans (strain ATCC 49978 / DSM 6589 / Su883) TaxID=525903 RepID=D1B9L9_THEAS|nr:hypothetical protein [Thermanaerovibrio acidaminovorans]ACZ18972.1 hypothetical protein Taci_0739 [Thermanaerovibrio acidaminovorans DSM 6589]